MAHAPATSDTVNIPPGGGSGSAAFDGGDVMQTMLDLSPFSTISVSWWQRTTSTSVGVLFEHSPNKNVNTGGFLADVNEIAAHKSFARTSFWSLAIIMSTCRMQLTDLGSSSH